MQTNSANDVPQVDSGQPARTASPELSSVDDAEAVHGFLPFSARGGVVTNELIDVLRDDDAW
ncbi:MAG: hypothetical protein JSR66_04370 [Proteobacteria bacterium]|nr:hypothetical protein [Pseudomonadota bacterium]